jgi:peroxiredoxin
VNAAQISYDSQEVLARFAKAYKITYPLLSDKGSVVIRKFGILNTNVPTARSYSWRTTRNVRRLPRSC